VRTRQLARVAGALALAAACATLLCAWAAPDNVLALWGLVAFCG
jgi:hypothetical protein